MKVFKLFFVSKIYFFALVSERVWLSIKFLKVVNMFYKKRSLLLGLNFQCVHVSAKISELRVQIFILPENIKDD